MKERKRSLLALILAVALMASGCGVRQMAERFEELREQAAGAAADNANRGQTAGTDAELLFSQMEYVRPDMEAFHAVLEEACAAAGSEDLDTVVDGIWAFYDVYDWFYTYYSLSDVHYCMDMTDPYWEEEYYYCVENSAAVDAALGELYYALAKSPCRQQLESDDYFGEGYFDAYDGENAWDESFTALLEREAALQNCYYDLSGETGGYEYGSEGYYDACAGELAQLLVDLIAVRQEMADYWGYESYADFAWDFYYYRDYTPGQMESYMAEISRELVPIYRDMAQSDIWDYSYRRCSESQIMDYVRQAAKCMGGSVWDAFSVMESRELCDITYGENKYATSFEVYLTCYEVPFVFLCPTLENYDKLTFAHEFGHFCNDYQSYGSVAGADVLEVFSQGMEYLSLCYSEGADALARVKLADSLSTYVEQAAFGTFEHRLYQLENPTVEDLYALYDEVALAFGFESVGYDKREFITIGHFYTNPLYIDSYVVSNDAAMQIYQLERERAGEGLAMYEKHLDTQEVWFLSFLDTAGLESPFAPGRLQSVRDLFRQELLP